LELSGIEKSLYLRVITVIGGIFNLSFMPIELRLNQSKI